MQLRETRLSLLFMMVASIEAYLGLQIYRQLRKKARASIAES